MKRSHRRVCRLFDQWVYRSGHPKLDIEFSSEPLEDLRILKIKISQIQQQEEYDNNNADSGRETYNYCHIFDFKLDMRLVFSTADFKNKDIPTTIPISKRITEQVSNNTKGKAFFSKLHPEVKQAIVKNIGQFERKEFINLLKPLLSKKNESYFVRSNAATVIGKSLKEDRILWSFIDNVDKESIISQLKDILRTSKSFQNVVASGAINGLKELSKDKNKDIVVDIANFLIENTSSKNEYFKRLAATSALSKFIHTRDDNKGKEGKVLQI